MAIKHIRMQQLANKHTKRAEHHDAKSAMHKQKAQDYQGSGMQTEVGQQSTKMSAWHSGMAQHHRNLSKMYSQHPSMPTGAESAT